VDIVENDDRSYVIAILSKHGTADVYQGQDMIKNLSNAVWETQGQPQENPGESEKPQKDS
jgi:hypothetical protein